MKPYFRAVGCFVHVGEEFLATYRRHNSTKPDTNCWAVPSGKVEEGESDCAAGVRELEEEAGIVLQAGDLEKVAELSFDFEEFTFVYVVLRADFDEKPNVALDERELSDLCWTTPRDCYERENLIRGFHTLLEKVYGVKSFM